MSLPSHTAPHLNFSITYQRSVELQLEIKINYRRNFGSQTTQIVGISHCCFALFCFLFEVPLIAQRLSRQSKFYFHNLMASN